jgi:type I restriction enzyme S subunit
LNPEFVYWFLKHNERYVKSRAQGSVTKTITKENVRNLLIAYPKKDEQDAIVDVLKSFRAKIELNNQINSTLEQISQTLFKRWFIDFEFPDENGNPYKSSSCRMVDSELGEIPDGWEVLPLRTVCSRITDGAHNSPKSVENGYPMASVKDMDDWGFELKSCRHISEADYKELVRNDCRPLAGDVLIAKDGSYLKHIFVVEKDLDLVILSSIAILRVNEKMDSHLLASFLRSETTLARMERYVSGAVLQRIVLKDFKQFPILVPPQEIQRSWAQIVLPLIQRRWRNVDEIQTLTTLRDILLPKLMSGKIRVQN